MTARALFPFLVITFGLTWGLAALFVFQQERIEAIFGPLQLSNPLFILAVYAPAIAAFILVLRHAGVAGLARYLKRFTYWRCPVGWYAFLIFGVPAVMYGGAAINGTLFTDPFPIDPWHAVFAAVALAAIVGPVEEFGWRGLALPLLQQRFTPSISSLILGIIWGLWHLPAFILSGTPQSGWAFGPFLLGAIALCFIATPLFNASRGSILLPALLHFQLNNPIYPDAQPYDNVLLILCAIPIVFLCRKSLTRDAAITEVIPDP